MKVITKHSQGEMTDSKGCKTKHWLKVYVYVYIYIAPKCNSEDANDL